MNYAVASFIERTISYLRRVYRRITAENLIEIRWPKLHSAEDLLAYLVNKAIEYMKRWFQSAENAVIKSGKAAGLAMQKLQSSLEDSLSTVSLFLELLTMLSITILAVMVWWSW
uniref:Uncharacterized protein n=1 Tax=Ignisphaera aggregans TaxID=334771 RepID=A0A7C2Z9K1_9CREN